MKKLFVFCVISIIFLAAFVPRKKSKLKLPAEFVLVPGGTTSLCCDTCCLYHGDQGKRITIPSFYMSKFEVTNQQYQQFYEEMASQFSESEKDLFACDTTGWQQIMRYCEPMVNYYYQHPAYKAFPLVNVNYEGAVKYCEWLQKKIQFDNPAFTIEVQLPEKNQWIWAAQGGRSNAMYPWGNYYLRNKKGEFLCNFKKLGDQSITRDKKTGKPIVSENSFGMQDAAFFTATVKSYYPNDFGLYNICGNVAEMINEKGIAMGGSWNDYGGDVHIKSEASYNKASPTVGFRPIIIFKEK